MILLFSLTLFFFSLIYTGGSISITLSMGLCLVLSADVSSYVFMLTIFTISVSVLIWSYYYLDSELVYRRFVGIVLVFLGSMFLLVFSGDLLALFVA